MAKDRQLSPQEALNYMTVASQDTWGEKQLHYDSGFGNWYSVRYDWRLIESTAVNGSTGDWTTVNGSTTITQASADEWPNKGQYVSGTGIPSGAYVVTKLSGTEFQISAAATASATISDGLLWDPDPADANGADTRHIDVSDSNRITIFCATYFQISFTNTPKDIAIIREGSQTDKKNWYDLSAGTQEGDLVLPSGRWNLNVPTGLGDTVYFNFRPYYRWSHNGHYLRLLTEGKQDV